MTYWRFEHIKHFLPHMWKYEKRKESDTCWKFISTVEYFNNNQRKSVASYFWKVFDGFMSECFPRAKETGGLLKLTSIETKYEPLGTEFKNVACKKTGVFIGIYL